MLRSKSDRIAMCVMYALITLFTILCLYPLVLTLMTSITDEQTLVRDGYRLIPAKFSLDAYQVIATSMGSKVANAYKITIIVTVLGTAIALFVTSAMGYVTSVREFRHRNILNMFVYIPMVFFLRSAALVCGLHPVLSPDQHPLGADPARRYECVQRFPDAQLLPLPAGGRL